MKKDKILDKQYDLDDHVFEVMHPVYNTVYPNSSWTLFCTTAEFDKTFMDFYPANARLFVDGENQGTLKELLGE